MSRNLSDLPIDMLPQPKKRTSQDDEWKAVLLRMPIALFKHIDAAAGANYRSRTAEILARLQASAEGESVGEHGVIVRILRRPSK